MGALIGFAVGYVMGARAGEEGLEELKEAWRSILDSDELRGFVTLGTMMARNAMTKAGTAVGQNLREMREGKGPLGEAFQGIPNGPELADVLQRLGESDEMRRLLATGGDLLGGVVAQFAAAAGIGREPEAERPAPEAK